MPPLAKKKIAAIVTEYRRWSHADVIIGKLLEGYNHDGKAGPAMEVVSMFVDQTPKTDTSRDLAKKHGFTIYDSIEKALTRGGKALAVEGVLCIGEHGPGFEVDVPGDCYNGGEPEKGKQPADPVPEGSRRHMQPFQHCKGQNQHREREDDGIQK